MSQDNVCSLCQAETLPVLWQDSYLRVVEVLDPHYPGYTRVIWNHHVREMTDLPMRDRLRLMDAVFLVETAQREILQPHKINLASLGNQVDHLHWHVIPRWEQDLHFPQPVWAQAQREQPMVLADIQTRLHQYRQSILNAFD